MTDKRFKCVFKEHETKNSWSMIKDNQLDKPLYIKDVVDLLNELSEENEQLRQRIKELQRSREYWIQDNNRLTKKNNELIAKIDFLERVIDGDV